MREPIAFLAEEVGDTMYYHQCLKQPDAGEFATAIVKEVNGHVGNGHWELMDRSQVP